MRQIIPIITITLMLAAGPAVAQTVEDPNAIDPTAETDVSSDATDETTTETEGNFSRSIPGGIKGNLSEEEISDYQAQLDAAETPQERNAIRQELQSLNQERHVASVQENKRAHKGFFESMSADFKDVMSGKAASDAKARSVASNGKAGSIGGRDKGSSARSSSSRGGGRGNSGGGNGGNGGGRSK